VISVQASGQETLEQAQRLLSGIEGGFNKALKNAIGKAAKRLRSSSAKAVRERYAISAANLRAGKNVRISYSYHDGVQAEVVFHGKLIPLYRFDDTSPARPTKDTSTWVPVLGLEGWRFMHPGVPARGHVLKSTSPYPFDHAFVASMSSGHTGIFERTGGSTSNKKDELRELYSPSLPEMLGNEEVAETLTKEAMKDFDQDLDQAVQRILSGVF